jgi:aspartyl-tRNA(Asn)/glutamyl-tRNA(Gln) amidotransferase subunit C
MAKLSREDVLKLAKLARLKLTENEIEQYRTELSEILGYVQQLQLVDVKGYEPTYQVTGLSSVMRADEPIDYGSTRSDLLKNVPSLEANQIKVKRVLE